jgi:hypothetical protein
MAVKCVNCGYEMSTAREFWRLISELLVRTGGAAIDLLRSPFGSTQGFVAEPLNALNASCPHCQRRGQWKDS